MSGRRTDQSTLDTERDNQIRDMKRCMVEVLDETVTTTDPLNYRSHEQAYNICHSLVVVHDAGSELYSVFTQRVEEALGRISGKLLKETDSLEAEDWIGLLVHYAKWFETRIVRGSQSYEFPTDIAIGPPQIAFDLPRPGICREAQHSQNTATVRAFLVQRTKTNAPTAPKPTTSSPQASLATPLSQRTCARRWKPG